MGAYLYGKDKENPVKVEAVAGINKALEAAQALVWEAERIADEHDDLSFSMNLGAYGMGGSYSPVESGWNASSQSC